ncbi:MAG TPA: heme ABC exporter ATP-binding protein CcmA [Ktedonobacteraceae bacterium]
MRELVKDDPIVQELFAKRKAEGRAEGKAEGRAEGKIEGLQEAILEILNARFPALAATSQVRQAVASIEDPEKLDLILQALLAASDEQIVRRLIPVRSPSVEICQLKKSFGLKPILRSVDLTLQQGQRMALLGANGAGKTTILRILAGLIKPSAGTVSVLGLDIIQDVQQIRRCVGFVGHKPYLYEELTILENLLFFARMYTVPHGQERVRELVRHVGLERRMHERVGALSRGQVQRVAWARALLHVPRLLLLDEPDTGLDRDGGELIDALLTEHIATGGSILFTTHLLERVLQQSDRIVILGNGRVVYNREIAGLELDELQRRYREVTS